MGAARRFWGGLPPGLRGIACMVAASLSFAVLHVLIRFLYLADEIHPIQMMFFRNLFGFLMFAPWLLSHGRTAFRTQRLPLHVLRASLNVVAMFMFFTALTLTPVARATALAFTAPIFAALMSVVILREKFRIRRWVALLCGFAGTILILRPGILTIDLGSMLVLGSSLMWGVTLIVIKQLARTESSLTITAYMNLLLAVFAFVPTLFVWTTPSMEGWMWLVVIGISGTFAQMMLAQAFRETDASTVLPFDFLKLIWTASLGYVLFAETIDVFVWVGAAIVLGSSIYLAYRESQVSGTPLIVQSNGRPT